MAKTDSMFDELEQKFEATVPECILNYYNKNWRPIKYEWFTGPQFIMSALNNTTNNRLECLNSKLKSVIKNNSLLEEFIMLLFTTLKVITAEHDHKVPCVSTRDLLKCRKQKQHSSTEKC